MRHRSGDARSSITAPPPPSSAGSFSKFKTPRSLVKKHQNLQYLVTFLVGCIILAYVWALSYVTDSGGDTHGFVETEADWINETVSDWRTNSDGATPLTPEGQQRLLDHQNHVSKELKELIQKLQYMKDKHPVAMGSEYNLFKPFNKKNKVQLDIKRDKKGNVVYNPITSVKKEDLLDMGYDKKQIDALGNTTHDEAIRGRERLVDILLEAGIDDIAPEAIAVLPEWSSVSKLYGDKPVILGLERCEEFRMQSDPIDASIGPAGMFNTGTNPMAMYISNNMKMPNNKKDKAGGTRWQVPWGKHRLASEKLTNTPPREQKTNKTNVLPIVMVRDPYEWMQSMCRHNYEARWPHTKECPNLAKSQLQDDGTARKTPLMLKYNPPIYFDSLADYWGQWYKEYLEADYPRLIVRFEDIQFHAKELIEIIGQCAGAVAREKDELFRYVVDSAKWGKAHQSKSNMISGMVKYGTDKNRFNGMTEADWVVAKEVFTPELMELFGYEMPEKLR